MFTIHYIAYNLWKSLNVSQTEFYGLFKIKEVNGRTNGCFGPSGKKKKSELSYSSNKPFQKQPGEKKKGGKRNFKFCAEGKEGKTIKSPD